MPLVKLRLSNDLIVPTRVAGVLVEFYNLSAVFQTSGTTDVNGEVTVTLPIAQYDVAMYKSGVTVLPKQPQRISVLVAPPNSNLFLVTVHERVLAEATDPLRCRITGYFLDPGGHRMVRGPRLTISPCPSLIVVGSDTVSMIDPLDVGPDQDGLYDFELLRDYSYSMYIGYLNEFFGIIPAQFTLCVPNLPGLSLSKLLFPVPIRFQMSAPTLSISLANGVNSSVTYTRAFSDETARPRDVPWASVKLVSSVPAVATASLQNGLVVVTPLSAGVTTISTERVISDMASYIPQPDFLEDTLLVTVT